MKCNNIMSIREYASYRPSSEDSGSESNQYVFSNNFPLDDLDDPTKFLPVYQKNQLAYEPTLNESCLSCTGQCCMYAVIPFACFGCTSCCCTYTLGTSSSGLVENFGRFKRLLKPGFNLINPCSEEVVEIDLKLKVLGVGRHTTMTKDNVKLDVEASVSYRVVNPIISHYQLGVNQGRALTELTISSIRHCVGEQNLDQVLSKRFEIAETSRRLVMEGIPAGISVENVFIDEIIIPPQIERDLNSAAKQRRLSEATIINSKASVQSAALMKECADLLDSKAAMQIRYLQMVQKLGQAGVLVMMDVGVNKQGFKM